MHIEVKIHFSSNRECYIFAFKEGFQKILLHEHNERKSYLKTMRANYLETLALKNRKHFLSKGFV